MKTVFKLFVVSLFALVLSCEQEEDISPVGNITLTTAAMTNQNGGTIVQLNWMYGGNATQLLHYKIQYSLHHGTWIDLPLTVENTVTSFTSTFPATQFLTHNTYAWRVIAVGQTEEAVSCYRETYLNGAAGTFGTLKLRTTNYTDVTTMEFDYDFSSIGSAISSVGIHPVIQKKTGTSWTEVADFYGTSFAAATRFSMPFAFVSGETYRVYLHGTETYYGQGNIVEFTYAPPHANDCSGERVIVEAPTITNLSMGQQMQSRTLDIRWTHPNPSSLTGFKIQYSSQHSPWIDFKTVSNQTFSSVHSFASGHPLGYYDFQSNIYYRWRVVALTNDLEIPSCSEQRKTDMGNTERNVHTAHLSVDTDYETTDAAIIFKLTTPFNGTTTSGWSYRIEKLQGGNWVQVGNIIPLTTLQAFPYTFSVPMQNFSANERFRIAVRQSFTTPGLGSNNIELYGRNWPVSPARCQ